MFLWQCCSYSGHWCLAGCCCCWAPQPLSHCIHRQTLLFTPQKMLWGKNVQHIRLLVRAVIVPHALKLFAFLPPRFCLCKNWTCFTEGGFWYVKYCHNVGIIVIPLRKGKPAEPAQIGWHWANLWTPSPSWDNIAKRLILCVVAGQPDVHGDVVVLVPVHDQNNHS